MRIGLHFRHKRFVLRQKGEYMFRKLKDEISNINAVTSYIQDKVVYMAKEFRNIE